MPELITLIRNNKLVYHKIKPDPTNIRIGIFVIILIGIVIGNLSICGSVVSLKINDYKPVGSRLLKMKNPCCTPTTGTHENFASQKATQI